MNGCAAMNDQSFPARLRLRSRADFARVYGRRQVASDDLMRIHGCLNELAHPRLGLSVSRKFGGAVARNRFKRLVREAFRLERARLPAGLDLIVIPRPAIEPDLNDVRKSLVRLTAKLAARLQSNKR